jgi:MFS family permease
MLIQKQNQGGATMKQSQTQNVRNWEPPKTIWNPMFLSIFFVNMALNLGQQMSNSLLSLYAKSMGSPADQIGQLMSMFAVTALIFRFISGPAMNSFNKKRLVALAMTCMATAYLGFSLSPVIAGTLGMETITVMKYFRMIQGVGNAFGNSCCLTIVADVLPKDKFTTGMGYYACAQVISQSIGPTVGIMLRDTFGYNKVYMIFAALMLTAMVASQLIKTAPHQGGVPFKLRFDNMIAKEAIVPATVTLMVAMGYTTINAFLLVYAEERGISGGSLFFTVYALTMLMTRPTVGKLTDKYGFVKVCIPSILATATSLVMIGYAPNTLFLLLAAFVNAFGYGAVQPMLQSLCIKSVSPQRRGSAASTNFIFLDAATIIGPSVCGWVADMMGYTPAMWTVMTVPVLLAVIFIFLFRGRIGKIEADFQNRTAAK